MILDLFAGPGGWSEGLRSLGLADLGIEFDAAACDTRYAAGHATWQADVSTIDPTPFRGICDGLIASPPCQDFSVAGKRAGITGERGELVLEVPRWVHGIRPRWVACEQVPPVLDIWKLFARWFEEWGYSTWCGLLDAADYGVPQNRKRAFLLAHLDRAPLSPEPTHADDPQEGLFGPALAPWITMARALGWGVRDDPAPVLMTARGRQTGHDVLRGSSWRREWFDRQQAEGNWVVRTGANSMKHSREGSKAGDGGVVPYERPVDRPAPTLDSKVGAWTLHTNRDQRPDGTRQTVPDDRPAPALTAKAGGQWFWERPATTVAGDPRITARCHHDEGSQGRGAKTTEQVRAGDYEGTEPIKLTVTEALILQGFPLDYPVQGTKTKQFEQVGNAVPPPLAAAVLRQVIA